MIYHFEMSIKHKCSHHTEGNEIIFTCLLCPEYERRINVITGKEKTKGVSIQIQHLGNYTNPHLGVYNPN